MLVATYRNFNEANFKNGVGDQDGFGEQTERQGAERAFRFARVDKPDVAGAEGADTNIVADASESSAKSSGGLMRARQAFSMTPAR